MLDRMETPTCSPDALVDCAFKKKALVVASATRLLHSGGSVHLFITTLLAGNLSQRLSGTGRQHTHTGALHSVPPPPSNQRQGNREAVINSWPQSDRITQTGFSEAAPPEDSGGNCRRAPSSLIPPQRGKLPTDPHPVRLVRHLAADLTDAQPAIVPMYNHRPIKR